MFYRNLVKLVYGLSWYCARIVFYKEIVSISIRCPLPVAMDPWSQVPWPRERWPRHILAGDLVHRQQQCVNCKLAAGDKHAAQTATTRIAVLICWAPSENCMRVASYASTKRWRWCRFTQQIDRVSPFCCMRHAAMPAAHIPHRLRFLFTPTMAPQ